MFIPDAWMVKYQHYGEERKFITLEKTRAIEYAQLHHGTYHPMKVVEPPAEASHETQAL